MSESSLRIETKLVHAGEPLPRILGAVEMPIFQSATFEYGGEGSYHDVRYLRTNNTPSQLALQAKIAALENAPASLVTASGMAAISTTLLTVLSAGDRLLAQSCLYGGTHDLMNRDFATLGLAVDFIDADRRESWQAQLRPTTRAIYVEAMTNPLLQVADLEAVVEFASAHRLTRQLPPHRGGLRSVDPQRHEVPQRPCGHRGGRGLRRRRADRAHPPQGQPSRRLARPPRRVPAEPGTQDARAPGALPEREHVADRALPRRPPGGRVRALRGARVASTACPRPEPVRRLRRRSELRAQGACESRR